MSDLENKKTEETPKKRPYNLREKKEKKAAYRSLIRPELADELYDKIPVSYTHLDVYKRQSTISVFFHIGVSLYCLTKSPTQLSA